MRVSTKEKARARWEQAVRDAARTREASEEAYEAGESAMAQADVAQAVAWEALYIALAAMGPRKKGERR